jgi:hypothetical protein
MTAVEYLVDLLETQNFITTSQIVVAKEIEMHQIIMASASAYEDMFGTDGTVYGEKYYDKLTQDDK